jgi:hypothetical protein
MQETTQENWKDIVGYKNRYQISDHGNVRNIQFSKKKIVKQEMMDDGYKAVLLFKNGVGGYYYVHELVAYHFLPHPEGVVLGFN